VLVSISTFLSVSFVLGGNAVYIKERFVLDFVSISAFLSVSFILGGNAVYIKDRFVLDFGFTPVSSLLDESGPFGMARFVVVFLSVSSLFNSGIFFDNMFLFFARVFLNLASTLVDGIDLTVTGQFGSVFAETDLKLLKQFVFVLEDSVVSSSCL
jgi:hypothetical protein